MSRPCPVDSDLESSAPHTKLRIFIWSGWCSNAPAALELECSSHPAHHVNIFLSVILKPRVFEELNVGCPSLRIAIKAARNPMIGFGTVSRGKARQLPTQYAL